MILVGAAASGDSTAGLAPEEVAPGGPFVQARAAAIRTAPCPPPSTRRSPTAASCFRRPPRPSPTMSAPRGPAPAVHLGPALLRPRRQARRAPASSAPASRPRPPGRRRAVRDQRAGPGQGRASALSTQVAAIVRLGGFIACDARLHRSSPAIMNGASDLMVEVFGDKGRHARSTIGVAACRWTPRSRSRRCSRSPEPMRRAGLDRRPAGRPSRPARYRRRRRREHAVGLRRPRSPAATPSNATSSSRPTARPWCSTTTRSTG